MDRPVTLWHITTPMMIVKSKTGVIYTNQTGGIFCNHPEVEGYLIPLPTNDEFTGRNVFNPDIWYEHGVQTPWTDIEEAFAGLEYSPMKNLRVDRAQFNEEAWVHVEFDYEIGYSGETVRLNGILTWPNCD